MFYRRVLYYWQFTAAVLLPTWVVVGRALFGSSMGWDFLLSIVLGLVLAVALGAVALTTILRKEVRSSKALSWRDAAALTPWHLAVVAFGIRDLPVFAAIVVLLAVVAFWSAVWQLFTETRSRVRQAFSLPDFPTHATARSGPVEAGHYSAKPTDAAPDVGRVIILEPDGYGDTPPEGAPRK